MAKTIQQNKANSVEKFLSELNHPLLDLLNEIRQTIASSSNQIAEEIKWNAPTFYFDGEMPPSNPKEYKKYIVVFNFSKKDCIRLIFLNANKIPDPEKIFEGTYTDGRRIVSINNLEDLSSKKIALQKIIQNKVISINE
jgi:hypothetical protein